MINETNVPGQYNDFKKLPLVEQLERLVPLLNDQRRLNDRFLARREPEFPDIETYRNLKAIERHINALCGHVVFSASPA